MDSNLKARVETSTQLMNSFVNEMVDCPEFRAAVSLTIQTLVLRFGAEGKDRVEKAIATLLVVGMDAMDVKIDEIKSGRNN